jgi:hypothetical protein
LQPYDAHKALWDGPQASPQHVSDAHGIEVFLSGVE